MSEIREELVRQFKAHNLLEDNEQNETPQPYTLETDASITEEKPATVEAQVIEEIIAPKSYTGKFADDFKNLPQEWQVFLNQHETENEEKLSGLNNQAETYRRLEDLFGLFQFRLQQRGIKCLQDWYEGLAWIDAAMDENPAETLNALAVIYGVKNFNPNSKQHPSDETIARLCKLEQSYHNLTSFLQTAELQRLAENLQQFAQQSDKDGNLLHPYFDVVGQQVFDLLSKGIVGNVNDAYEFALWTTPVVRNELIKQQISSQAAEAEKAKKAAFAPKGKAETPEKSLTVREELEKNMAALFG